MKKRMMYTAIALLSMMLLLGACSSNNNSDNNTPPENNNNENVNDNTGNVEEDNTNDMNNEEENEEENDSAEDEDVDHQEGLKFGETGTVISGDISENYRAEITPVSVEFLDEFYHEERDRNYDPKEDVFVKVTVDVKNTDDKAYELKKITNPALAVYDSEEVVDLKFQNNTFDEEVDKAGEELSIEDEIAPGEEVTISYIFDREEADDYYFIFGSAGDQIVTYAQWEIEAADFE